MKLFLQSALLMMSLVTAISVKAATGGSASDIAEPDHKSAAGSVDEDCFVCHNAAIRRALTEDAPTAVRQKVSDLSGDRQEPSSTGRPDATKEGG